MSHANISVVIPAYNASEVIIDAVWSALGQDEVAEVIVIDDGSSDDTFSKVSKIKSSKIVLKRQNNKGASAARNYGASLASYEYIAFLDADDCFLPRRFKMQLSAMKRKGLSISISSVLVGGFNLDKMKPFSKMRFSELSREAVRAAIFAQLLIMNTPTIIVTKALFDQLGGFDESLRLREDHKFLIDALAISKVHIEPSFCVLRRTYENSTTSAVSAESLISGNYFFLERTKHKRIEATLSHLSLFHVLLRRFRFFTLLPYLSKFFTIIPFYPFYLIFRIFLR